MSRSILRDKVPLDSTCDGSLASFFSAFTSFFNGIYLASPLPPEVKIMETKNIEQGQGSVKTDPLVRSLKQRIELSVHDAVQSNRMDVEVKRRGAWFVLKGRVSSYRLKLKLFSWVPRVQGEQRIVDKLQVRSARRRYVKEAQ
jgi:hypothetical protein